MPIRQIKMVVMDVDGVLTDSVIDVGADGEESKHFCVQDGSAIKYLQRVGLKTAIISGRHCSAVDHRMMELGVGCVRQNIKNKIEAYKDIKAEFGLDDSEICFIGDDLPDIPVMRETGFPVAVANARQEVKDVALYVTRTRGGQGAVREVAEKILRCQGKWPEIMRRYNPDAVAHDGER